MGKRWSKEELEYLISNHGKMNNSEIAKYLNRTKKAIEDCARILHITKYMSRYKGTKTLSNHPLYGIWNIIKIRCSKKAQAHDLPYYYLKGIRVCNKWKKDFMSFYNWAIVNGYKKGLQIHRINNNKNYSPKNCIFITPKEHIRIHCKLNIYQVISILNDRYINNMKYKTIKHKYNISDGCINGIVHYKIWKDISEKFFKLHPEYRPSHNGQVGAI